MRTALIGYGYWGRNVLKALMANPFFEVVSVFDSDISQVNAAKTQLAFKEFDSLTSLLADTNIEAVCIITPPHTHFEIAKLALESNKHIFVEKPLAMSLKECEILYEIALRKNLIVHCDHIFLYAPAVRWLKDNIQSFGSIVYVQARRINLGLFQTGVDVIWDLAIHDLAILDFIFGLDIRAHHTLRNTYKNFNALADIHLELEGFNANINVSWLSPIKVREMMIGGESKTAIYDETKKDKIALFDCGIVLKESLDKNNLYKKMVQYHLGEVTYPSLPKSLPLDNSIQEFQNQILSKHINPKLKAHTLRVIRGLEIISS